MCPLCIGSAALILTASGSAGGVTLIAAKVFGVRLGRTAAKVPENQPAVASQDRTEEAQLSNCERP
jgi:hypothetical protein